MNIREITLDDAAAFLELCKSIDAETRFMLYEQGERRTTLAEQRERIEKLLSSGNSTIFVAENEQGELVGYLTAAGGEAKRNQHNVYIVVGILKAYTGQKIGTRLFAELEAWARAKNLYRLGLGLMATNETAFALYEKMGFVPEGRKRAVFLVDGTYVDEIMMSKLLN